MLLNMVCCTLGERLYRHTTSNILLVHVLQKTAMSMEILLTLKKMIWKSSIIFPLFYVFFFKYENYEARFCYFSINSDSYSKSETVILLLGFFCVCVCFWFFFFFDFFNYYFSFINQIFWCVLNSHSPFHTFMRLLHHLEANYSAEIAHLLWRSGSSDHLSLQHHKWSSGNSQFLLLTCRHWTKEALFSKAD